MSRPRTSRRKPPERRRLSREERREQLVGIGLDLIKSRPFDQVLIDDVIAEAGVSKGLLFHYFASRKDYFAAVIRRGSEELLAGIVIDPDATQPEQLRAGLEAFVGYIEQQPESYLAISRGAGSDPQLVAIFEDARNAIVERIIEALGVEATGLLRLAVRGWVSFVEETTLAWWQDPVCARDRLLELCELAALQVIPTVATWEVPARPVDRRRLA